AVANGAASELADTFTYRVTDSLGNTTTNTITVNAADDHPLLGPIDNSTHSDNPADAAATGNLHLVSGADAPATIASISDVGDHYTALGGVPVVYSYNGSNVLTGYLDNNHDGVFNAGDTTVFTLTLNTAGGTLPGQGTYSFNLVTPLDGQAVVNSVSGGSSFGSGPTQFQTLLAGTTSVGLLAGFSTGVNSTTLSLSGATQGGVNGSSAGWGVGSNNFTAGEAFVLDFHTAASGSGFPVGYTPPPGFSSSVTNTVTIAFPHFNVGDVIEYKVYYGDPNGSGNSGVVTHTLTSTDISTGMAISAPIGKSIDYIEVYDKSGSGKFQVVSTGTISNVVNDTLHFSVTAHDADGTTSSPAATFTVTVSGSAAPIVLDLDHNGVQFVGLSAGMTFDYLGDGHPLATAWAAAGDGVLALQTATGYKVAFGGNGLTDLQGLAAQYDTNHDGVLDAHDANWAQFGALVTQANGTEVFESLAQLGISSIKLTSDGQSYVAANGDVVVQGTTTFTKADGTTGTAADASFATDALRQATTTELATTTAAASALLAAMALEHANPAAAAGLQVATAHTLDMPVTQASVSVDLPAAAAEPAFNQASPVAVAKVAQVVDSHQETVAETQDIRVTLANLVDHGALKADTVESAQKSALFNFHDASSTMDALLSAGGQGVAAQTETVKAQPVVAEALSDALGSQAVDSIVQHFAVNGAELAGTSSKLGDFALQGLLNSSVQGSGHEAGASHFNLMQTLDHEQAAVLA
ncbi:MAG: hypothetical protein KGM49_13570, partial [Sphingomonadales bacterium]|nr:hypothetical protein [Sphingomonadales bacterium]